MSRHDDQVRGGDRAGEGTAPENQEHATEAAGAGAGALAGAGVGAVVGGPVGAAVGGVVGAVGGAMPVRPSMATTRLVPALAAAPARSAVR